MDPNIKMEHLKTILPKGFWLKTLIFLSSVHEPIPITNPFSQPLTNTVSSLKIENLTASIDGKNILEDLNLELPAESSCN